MNRLSYKVSRSCWCRSNSSSSLAMECEIVMKNGRRSWFVLEFSVNLIVDVWVGDQVREFLRGRDESWCGIRVGGRKGRHCRQFSTFQWF